MPRSAHPTLAPATAQPALSRQHAAWRALAPAAKLALFRRHMAMLRELNTAGVKATHPDWPDDRVRAHVARTYLHGHT